MKVVAMFCGALLLGHGAVNAVEVGRVGLGHRERAAGDVNQPLAEGQFGIARLGQMVVAVGVFHLEREEVKTVIV
jgi:hypothetical protein